MRPDVALAAGSSPHTRGARPAARNRRIHPGIIPAYAGSTAFASSHFALSTDHPRIRGEHGVSAYNFTRQAGSSPHTRGARVFDEDRGQVEGIIPAYAGSTSLVMRSCCLGRDHPRIRGEHLRGFLEVPGYGGSSPHTRGAPHAEPRRRILGGIIPAYAGSTVPCSSRSRSRRDHPRIRGEHRGVGANRQPRGWIIPAYAGSTSRRDRHGRLPSDHPRIRGEHPFLVGRACGPPGSSPHTRGARVARIRPRMRARIIPAYAGSTS